MTRSDNVDDGERLVRTSFSPSHVRDGKLLPTAIRTDDLSERGFSVDRDHLICVATMSQRIKLHMENCPAEREEAWISVVDCGIIRNEVLPSDGGMACRIEAEPMHDNIAHAAIYSATPRTKAGIKALRALLLPYFNKNLCVSSEFLDMRAGGPATR